MSPQCRELKMQNCSLLISPGGRDPTQGLVGEQPELARRSPVPLVSQDMARAPQRPPAGPLPASQALALAGPKVSLAFPGACSVSSVNQTGVCSTASPCPVSGRSACCTSQGVSG